jgi:hypothetical protein
VTVSGITLNDSEAIRGAAPARSGKNKLARLLAALVFLAVPLLCAVFAARALAQQQPFWGGRMNDPSYTYLINGLNLATGHAPDHIDHPGTPVQALVGLTLHALHPGASRAELAEVVLNDPERHARVASVVLIGIALVALAAAALWTFLQTGSLFAAMAVQSGVILVPDVLAGLSGLRPEVLLLGMTPWWVACWIVWANGRLNLDRPATLAAVAALAAFGLACKLTFLPLAVIPLLLVQSWRARAGYGAAALGCLIVFVAPALPSWRRIVSWLFRLATREGIYGGGDIGIAPAGGWIAAFRKVFENNVGFCLVALGALVLIPFLSRRSDPAAPGDRHLQLVVAVTVALFASLIMVAKQPGGSTRYLLAAAMATPLVVYAACQRLLRVRSAARVVLATIVVAALLLRLDRFASRHLAALEAEHVALSETDAWIDRSLRGEVIIPYFGASSLSFALSSGDYFSHRWSAVISRLHPRSVYFDLWGVQFRQSFSGEPCPMPSGVFYLRGIPLELTGLVAAAASQLPFKLTKVWANPVECVYRADPV